LSTPCKWQGLAMTTHGCGATIRPPVLFLPLFSRLDFYLKGHLGPFEGGFWSLFGEVFRVRILGLGI